MPFKAPADDQTLLWKHFWAIKNKTSLFFFQKYFILPVSPLKDKFLIASSRVALDVIHKLSMRKRSFQ